MSAKKIYSQLLKVKDTNASALEKAAGIGNKTVQRAMDRDSSTVTLGTAQKICALYPDISLEWLLTGEGEMFVKPYPEGEQETFNGNIDSPNATYVRAPTGKVPRRAGAGAVPYYDADFEAGGGVTFYEDIRSSQPAYTMDVPDFAGCTAFRTYGHSMEPLIASGAILFGTKDEHWRDYLEYGQIYGIVCKNGRRFLKQVRKSQHPETHLLLVSENKEYDAFELPSNVIKSMWLIHGWLNKNT